MFMLYSAWQSLERHIERGNGFTRFPDATPEERGKHPP